MKNPVKLGKPGKDPRKSRISIQQNSMFFDQIQVVIGVVSNGKTQ